MLYESYAIYQASSEERDWFHEGKVQTINLSINLQKLTNGVLLYFLLNSKARLLFGLTIVASPYNMPRNSIQKQNCWICIDISGKGMYFPTSNDQVIFQEHEIWR